MIDEKGIEWLRERWLRSLVVESKDPSDLISWLEQRRQAVPFAAELISLNQVRNWQQDGSGNFHHSSGQFFSIEGVRVQSAPGLREIAGWDQPIFTQKEGGVLALVCRETAGQGLEFLLQAKADPGNIGYLQFCPTIQSTWENIRGLKGARPATFSELLHPSDKVRVIYRSRHNEEGSRFWRKSNENMILFLTDPHGLPADENIYRWASLSQIKRMILLDDVVGPYVRTVISAI